MKLAAIVIAASVLATPALAKNKPVVMADTPILQYITVGAIVGGAAGALLCAGNPVCVIAGAKLTTLGGAAIGAGVGAVSGGTAAAVVR